MTFDPRRTLRRQLAYASSSVSYVSLDAAGVAPTERLPVSLRILLENVLRGAPDDAAEIEADVIRKRRVGEAISFRPARVLLQDLLGIALMTDLAALRDAVADAGGDPARVNPQIPSTLVIDHSLRADVTGVGDAPARNLALEHARNTERFSFLRWCQNAFRNLDVVPPGKGIMHQINLERISRVVWTDTVDGELLAYPDTLIGTDSHTTMVNGICVLGWGVGGIEAEAAMLGRSLSIALPRVLGVEVTGRLPVGTTATDLVLVIAQMLRRHGVVGKLVEFFGPGLEALSVPDRATIANMSPEYGSTSVLFPIDRLTIEYLRLTGRAPDQLALVEAYARAQGLWREPAMAAPEFDEVIALDLASVRPSIAGPRLPEDRIDLDAAARSFMSYASQQTPRAPHVAVRDAAWTLPEGAVVIAAITSCTNTSNPAGIATAGLVAKHAVARGLTVKPWVKTSFAPGSQAIAAFTEQADLQRWLDMLGFNVIGFGCTTCNGMSGPIEERLAEAIDGGGLVATAVLSGNRNFEGRIHPNVRAAYLASPALVVAYALAGSMQVDIAHAPLGHDRDGKPVLLAEIWPTPEEVAAAVDRALAKTDFAGIYAQVFDGDPVWKGLDAGQGLRYRWDSSSTYIRKPPYFDGIALQPAPIGDLKGLRPLAILGDSITTDHITPSGAIAKDSVGGKFLIAHGVAPAEFNSYGTRRGNFELVSRATFANIRLRNRMVPGKEGSWTKLMPEGSVMAIFDAALAYAKRGERLVVIAGKDYGCGSSRDTAAKGPKLLGVAAVVAESFERIHRSNLVGMGILPLAFADGVRVAGLDLDGSETFDVIGLDAGLRPGLRATLRIHAASGPRDVPVICRIDTPEEAETIRHGGILPSVMRALTAPIAAE